MSVRPSKVADDARAFSLRDIVSSAPPERKPAAVASSDSLSDAPFLVTLSGSPQAHPAPRTSASQPKSSGLSFSLPAMSASKSASARTLPLIAASSSKTLSAGYIAGGTSGDSKEVMRLNALVDDLQNRLSKTTEKIAAAELSVVRANQALSTERISTASKLGSFQKELALAQAAEAKAKADLAAVPKQARFDEEKFKLQAEGAIELHKKYEEQLASASVMEASLFAVTSEKASLIRELDESNALLKTARSEKEDVQSKLDAALLELEVAKELAEVSTGSAEAGLAAKIEQLGAEVREWKSTASATQSERDAARAEVQTAYAASEAQEQKIAEAQALAEAAQEATRLASSQHEEQLLAVKSAAMRDLSSLIQKEVNQAQTASRHELDQLASRHDDLINKHALATGELAKMKQSNEELRGNLRAAVEERDSATAAAASAAESALAAAAAMESAESFGVESVASFEDKEPKFGTAMDDLDVGGLHHMEQYKKMYTDSRLAYEKAMQTHSFEDVLRSAKMFSRLRRAHAEIKTGKSTAPSVSVVASSTSTGATVSALAASMSVAPKTSASISAGLCGFGVSHVHDQDCHTRLASLPFAKNQNEAVGSSPSERTDSGASMTSPETRTQSLVNAISSDLRTSLTAVQKQYLIVGGMEGDSDSGSQTTGRASS